MTHPVEPQLIHNIAGQILEFLAKLDHSEQNKIAALKVTATTIEESVSAQQMADLRANLSWNARKRP